MYILINSFYCYMQYISFHNSFGSVRRDCCIPLNFHVMQVMRLIQQKIRPIYYSVHPEAIELRSNTRTGSWILSKQFIETSRLLSKVLFIGVQQAFSHFQSTHLPELPSCFLLNNLFLISSSLLPLLLPLVIPLHFFAPQS
jgi:hypothetical protein